MLRDMIFLVTALPLSFTLGWAYDLLPSLSTGSLPNSSTPRSAQRYKWRYCGGSFDGSRLIATPSGRQSVSLRILRAPSDFVSPVVTLLED
jgi:hypothetical protein